MNIIETMTETYNCLDQQQKQAFLAGIREDVYGQMKRLQDENQAKEKAEKAIADSAAKFRKMIKHT